LLHRLLCGIKYMDDCLGHVSSTLTGVQRAHRTMIRNVFIRWLPFAGLATALCMLIYLAVQQVGRQNANDPQIQMAREARAALASGQSISAVIPASQVDISSSISPFITAVSDNGSVIASSGRLHGQLRTLPRGVFANLGRDGEETVTWQPEPGVRMATVVTRNPGSTGGFIVVGRSLLNTEIRIQRIGSLLLLGWVGTLIGLMALIAIGEALDPHPH
jgi:hypothetical protein